MVLDAALGAWLVLASLALSGCDSGEARPGDGAVSDQAQIPRDLGVPAEARPDGSSMTPDVGTVAYTGSFPTGQGTLSATLTLSGVSRSISLYRPQGLPAAPPLLIVFHGTNGDAAGMITSSYAKELADSQKVIVASPKARTLSGDWDHPGVKADYWETYPAVTVAQNADLKLVKAIIAEAVKTYGVDRRRVYTLGHSSGGFFAILAAMALPYEIAGFAESSGGLVHCATTKTCTFAGSGTSCAALAAQAGYCACTGAEKPGPILTAGRKPPGYLFHHSGDPTVSAAYTCRLSERMQALGYSHKTVIDNGPYHSMPYLFAQTAWSYLSSFTLP